MYSTNKGNHIAKIVYVETLSKEACMILRYFGNRSSNKAISKHAKEKIGKSTLIIVVSFVNIVELEQNTSLRLVA